MCGVLGWPCLPCPLYCQPAPARLNAAAPRLPNLASHLCPLVLVVLGVVLSVWGLAGIGPPFYAPPPSAPLPALTGTAPRRWGARAQGPWGAYAAAAGGSGGARGPKASQPFCRSWCFFVVKGRGQRRLARAGGGQLRGRGQAGSGQGRQGRGSVEKCGIRRLWKVVECGKLWNVESCGKLWNALSCNHPQEIPIDHRRPAPVKYYGGFPPCPSDQEARFLSCPPPQCWLAVPCAAPLGPPARPYGYRAPQVGRAGAGAVGGLRRCRRWQRRRRGQPSSPYAPHPPHAVLVLGRKVLTRAGLGQG